MNTHLSNFWMTLRRYKAASVLNVVGLTFSFVAFYVISSQVWYTLTYNDSLKDAENTYLISPNFGDPSNIRWSTNSPGALAYETMDFFPDAEEVASIVPYPKISRIWVKENDYHFESFNDYVYQATSNTPAFFGFKCLDGNFSELKNPNTVIVSRSMADKLDVGVGETIWFEGGQKFDDGKATYPQTVVAIYEDMQKNCIFGHWGIIQNDEGVFSSGNNNWNYSNYVRFREAADLNGYIEIFKQRYAEWYLGMVQKWVAEDPEEEEYLKEEIENGVHLLATRLVRVDKMYYTEFHDSGNFQTGKKSTPIILSSIALIIVLIAFINFINFFLALIPVRMRSVNICKVFGASQRALRWSFLFEAIGLVLISMVFTLLLVIAIENSFITDYSICSLAIGNNIPVIMMIICLIVLIAVVAALYPAFYITKFNASMGVKRGFAHSAAGRRMRSIIVGIQFTVAIFLIIVTSVFFLQYRYMVNYDLGFDKENIVTFASWDLGTRSETVVERLKQHPDVMDVTTSQMNLLRCIQRWGRTYGDKQYHIRANGVRWNFLQFFGFEVVDGNGFTQSSNKSKDMIMTQRLHRDIGIPIGNDEGGFTYVGIIKDVRLQSIGQSEEYNTFYCASGADRMSHFYVKLHKGANNKAFADYVKDVSKELAPAASRPEVRYMEQIVEDLYSQTKKDMVLIGLFAVLAIVITLMGVFGVVMFETQHKYSEIAVRKVYGATSRQLISMLNSRYVWIILYCFFIAAPLAWWFSSNWLQQFANRISTPYWIYALALFAVMAVTVGIITLRSWKAATADPAEALKTE